MSSQQKPTIVPPTFANQDEAPLYTMAWIESGRTSASVSLTKSLRLHRYTLACIDCESVELPNCLTQADTVHFIYVENPTQPSVFTLRQLLCSCLGLVSPITLHCGPYHGLLKKTFEPLTNFHFSAQNYTDIKFFHEIIEQRGYWKNRQHLRSLHAVRSNLLLDNKKTALRLLSQLINEERTAVSAGLCMSLLLQQVGEIQAAEKILLSLFKKNHMNCAVILGLSQLYLNLSSPSTTMDLLNSALKNAVDPTIYILDLCQALIMLDKLDECIEQLKKLQSKNFAGQIIKDIMPRLYFAAGLQHRFEEAMDNSLDEVNRFSTVWKR